MSLMFVHHVCRVVFVAAFLVCCMLPIFPTQFKSHVETSKQLPHSLKVFFCLYIFVFIVSLTKG